MRAHPRNNSSGSVRRRVERVTSPADALAGHLLCSYWRRAAYLGVEVAALLHERADREPEAVGKGEVVDGDGQPQLLGLGVHGADVCALGVGPRKARVAVNT